MAPSLADELNCPDCGYDLRMLASPRCPECGAAVDIEGLRAVTLPWGQQGSRGRAGGWLRTVVLAVRRPNEVVAGLGTELPMRSARRFARWCAVPGAMLAAGVELARPLVSDGQLFMGRKVGLLADGTWWRESLYLLAVGAALPGAMAVGAALFVLLLPLVVVECVGVTLRKSPPRVLHEGVWLAHMSGAGSLLLGVAALLWAVAARQLPTILGPLVSAHSAGTKLDAAVASLALTGAIFFGVLSLVPLAVLPAWVAARAGGWRSALLALAQIAVWSYILACLLVSACVLTPGLGWLAWISTGK